MEKFLRFPVLKTIRKDLYIFVRLYKRFCLVPKRGPLKRPYRAWGRSDDKELSPTIRHDTRRIPALRSMCRTLRSVTRYNNSPQGSQVELFRNDFVWLCLKVMEDTKIYLYGSIKFWVQKEILVNFKDGSHFVGRSKSVLSTYYDFRWEDLSSSKFIQHVICVTGLNKNFETSIYYFGGYSNRKYIAFFS